MDKGHSDNGVTLSHNIRRTKCDKVIVSMILNVVNCIASQLQHVTLFVGDPNKTYTVKICSGCYTKFEQSCLVKYVYIKVAGIRSEQLN